VPIVGNTIIMVHFHRFGHYFNPQLELLSTIVDYFRPTHSSIRTAAQQWFSLRLGDLASNEANFG